MKNLMMMALIASLTTTANAGQFGRSCDTQYRRIDDVLRRAANAATDVNQDLRELSRLIAALDRAAQLVGGGGGTVNLTGELNPMISDAENVVRSAQGGLQQGLSELRRTVTEPDLGSQAYTIAGRAADTLENAKSTMVTAANRVADIKTRISQLHLKLGNNAQLGQAKNEIVANLRSLGDIASGLQGLSMLTRVSTDVSDYTFNCSDTSDMSCGDIRRALNNSASRTSDAAIDTKSAAQDANRLERQIDRLVSGLGGGSSIDLNAVLNEYIDRNVLPGLQESANNLHNAAVSARQASTASSGVLFDQLIKNSAIPSAERAGQFANSGLSGLSGLRNQVSTVASQIGSGGGGVSAQELRSAARDVNQLGRQVERSIERLRGTGWNSEGLISETSSHLGRHHNLCEVRSF
ncbi:MAG TPA: hypothetical protein VFV50_13330 [Bdellovibrionales bacterium]|nr:hypothetical protein [Bdellovibrionales bacterium]